MNEESANAGQAKDTSTSGEAGDQGSQTLLSQNTTGAQGQGDTGDTGTDANQATGGKSKEGADGKEGNGEPAGAPENYEPFKMPEGMILDGERLNSFQEFARKNNWSQDQAQEAVDYYLKAQEEAMAGLETALSEKIKEWGDETRSDPVLSKGDFDANMATAIKGVGEVQKMVSADFGDSAKDLVAVLEETGVGSHPGLVQMFYSLSKRLGEGSLHTGAPGGVNGPKSDADVLYPKT